MQQQGISMDQIDAKRVIFELEDKTMIIEQPEVFLMKQMGQEIYQVVGTAEEKEISISTEEREKIEASSEIKETFDKDLKPTITEQLTL